MTPDSLVKQRTSTGEIADLFKGYAVAIADASLKAQSADGRYVDAYTAGFLLAKIAIRVDALDAARRTRNADMYDGAGLVDESDVDALMARVAVFEKLVQSWLAEQHPELLA